jgi:hypothetical protein
MNHPRRALAALVVALAGCGVFMAATRAAPHSACANKGRRRVVILLATLLRAKQPAAIPVTP